MMLQASSVPASAQPVAPSNMPPLLNVGNGNMPVLQIQQHQQIPNSQVPLVGFAPMDQPNVNDTGDLVTPDTTAPGSKKKSKKAKQQEKANRIVAEAVARAQAAGNIGLPPLVAPSIPSTIGDVTTPEIKDGEDEEGKKKKKKRKKKPTDPKTPKTPKAKKAEVKAAVVDSAEVKVDIIENSDLSGELVVDIETVPTTPEMKKKEKKPKPESKPKSSVKKKKK